MKPAPTKNTSRLILGTAQFGLSYGISNQRGQIPQEEINSILKTAAAAGIGTLDTAAAYGNSEQRLGEALYETGVSLKVISKYPPNSPGKRMALALRESLELLQQERLYAYLLHSYGTYGGNPAVLDELQELKATGQVEKTGLSLYHPAEAEELLNSKAPVDIVQLPYSILDRRFEQVLPALRQRGIETHVRSVYLQGLYFMQPDRLPPHLQGAAPKLERLQKLAQTYQLPIGAVCLGFVLANPFISQAVIGIESLQTLQENILFSQTEIPDALRTDLLQLKEEDENVILPYKWPTT